MTAKTLYSAPTFVNLLSEYQPVHISNEPYKYSHIIVIRTIYVDMYIMGLIIWVECKAAGTVQNDLTTSNHI